MKKLLFYSLIFLFVSSCSDDDESTPDFRLQAVGEYTYSASFTSSGFGNFTNTGDLKVESLGTSGLRLIFDQGDADSFTLNASGTNPASNGVVFNVSSTTSTDDEGDSFAIRGVAAFDQAGVKYHGLFDSVRKQIQFSGETDYVDDSFDDFNSKFTVLATKK